MSETPRTLADLAIEIRSKNAGPFWVTIEAFMRTSDSYAMAARLISADLIATLFGVAASDVQIFQIPTLQVVKASFPRRIPQASLHDRDVHTGQHHVLLGRVPVMSHVQRSPSSTGQPEF
jgi:Domain of unknown function (DUF4387)